MLRARLKFSSGSFKTEVWTIFHQQGKDLTQLFWSLYHRPHGFLDQLHVLRRYHILYVPGLMSGLFHATSHKNFHGQLKWMKKMGHISGVHYSLADINTFGNTPEVADQLQSIVAKINRPIILFTHSKGTLDAIEFLLRYPRYRSQVKSIIGVQAPYFGTPAAELLANHRIYKYIVHPLLKVKGQKTALYSLLPEQRLSYWANNKDEIMKLCDETFLLSFVSWFDQGLAPRLSFNPKGVGTNLMKQFMTKMHKMGYANDGVVPKESQWFPKSHRVFMPSIDHAALTMFSSLPVQVRNISHCLLHMSHIFTLGRHQHNWDELQA